MLCLQRRGKARLDRNHPQHIRRNGGGQPCEHAAEPQLPGRALAAQAEIQNSQGDHREEQAAVLEVDHRDQARQGGQERAPGAFALEGDGRGDAKSEERQRGVHLKAVSGAEEVQQHQKQRGTQGVSDAAVLMDVRQQGQKQRAQQEVHRNEIDALGVGNRPSKIVDEAGPAQRVGLEVHILCRCIREGVEVEQVAGDEAPVGDIVVQIEAAGSEAPRKKRTIDQHRRNQAPLRPCAAQQIGVDQPQETCNVEQEERGLQNAQQAPEHQQHDDGAHRDKGGDHPVNPKLHADAGAQAGKGNQ